MVPNAIIITMDSAGITADSVEITGDSAGITNCNMSLDFGMPITIKNEIKINTFTVRKVSVSITKINHLIGTIFLYLMLL